MRETAWFTHTLRDPVKIITLRRCDGQPVKQRPCAQSCRSDSALGLNSLCLDGCGALWPQEFAEALPVTHCRLAANDKNPVPVKTASYNPQPQGFDCALDQNAYSISRRQVASKMALCRVAFDPGEPVATIASLQRRKSASSPLNQVSATRQMMDFECTATEPCVRDMETTCES